VSEVHEFSFAGRPLTGFDEFGCEWTVERIEGWTDGVGLRAQREVRSGADGEWDTNPLRSAREVSVIGKVLAPSHAALEQSMRDFTALPLRGEMLGSSEGVTLAAMAYVSDQLRFAHSESDTGTYQLTVVAPDPLLYGPPVVLSVGTATASGGTGRVWPRVWPRDWGVTAGTQPGLVTVPNGGTAPYWPHLRLNGPGSNFLITQPDTGDWLRYTGTLLAGQWLDIDCGNRSVLINGQISHAHKVEFSGRWLVTPPGGAGLMFTASGTSGATSMDIVANEGAYW
jgi:hypothetical protein